MILQYRPSNSVFTCLTKWRVTSPDFHVNIYEFIALIINVFFMMMSVTNLLRQGSPILPNLDRWIFLLEADNTSSLYWISRLSHMREYHIVNICHLFSHIIFYFNTMFPPRFDVHHIVGIVNVEADALSCPQDHPTYERIFQNCPEMASLSAYCVSLSLISAINACL